ncbi:MAG: 50S ribosomal protein L11 methyltransferase [Flavobacteriaceae bacterium]|nr:50S ribosomal protein L11 methyltransferase [Flavobacteriaceae bacterium]
MQSTYISYTFIITPKDPAAEILIAELGYVGFESFVETEEGVIAYIQKEEHSNAILENIFILKNDAFKIVYKKEEIAPINWNEEWEKNFNSIQIENTVSIRAPFHKKSNLKYDIIIEPKMSFGTGHHQTTHMMVKHLLDIDLKGKIVLDMGCGTGVLAILSEILGAKKIDAIDIDNWCYLNSIENTARNNCKKIKIFKGDASLLINKKYDVIIANINRNILLHDIQIYCNILEENGVLLLSGFYQEDISIIDIETSKYGLKLQTIEEMKNWVALRYINSNQFDNFEMF